MRRGLWVLILAHPMHAQTTTGRVLPYADTFSGADIGAKVNAAFDRCRQMTSSCVVELEPNHTYPLATTIRIPAVPATLDCHGSILQFQGTGDAILVAPGPPGPPFLSGGIENCVVLGNANARSNGIHQQSRVGFLYDRVAIRNFTGAESSGMLWETVAGNAQAPGWNEQDVIRKLDLGNCTTGFRLVRGSGTDSFAYNRIEDLHIDVMDGQTGMSLEGNGSAGSTSLIHSEISLRANVNAAARGARVLSVTRGARFEGSRLNLLAEQTSGSAASYGLYVDASSVVYAQGSYQVGNLKVFSAGHSGNLVIVPALNPLTGSVHFEPSQQVIEQRHCKFDLGPLNATFWLASYGGSEVDCSFQLQARNTDDANPDVDRQEKGAAPVNVLFADGKSKSVGIGSGFSNQAPPKATLSVSGTTQLGSSGTPITKVARYDAVLSPGAIPANTCAAHSFTVAGIEAGDVVLAINPQHTQAGLVFGGYAAPAAGNITLNFCNLTSAAITPPAEEHYAIVVMR